MLSPGCLVQARAADADWPRPPAERRALHKPLRALLPWPLPALLAWSLAWLAFVLLRQAGLALWLAAWPAAAVPAAMCRLAATPMRRAIVCGGFPLSLLAGGAAAGLPAWGWLAPLAALALLYPRSAWRDAPLFPTPPRSLRGIERLAPLPAGARLLDAGCGLGHGLEALRRSYPAARLEGVERSLPIAWLARLRCRWAQVRAGDMWAGSWRGLQMVYLFQRPESMPRAVDKARAELAAGAWMVSLEFPAPGLEPQAVLWNDGNPEGRNVWLYRMPFVAAARPAPGTAAAPAGTRRSR